MVRGKDINIDIMNEFCLRRQQEDEAKSEVEMSEAGAAGASAAAAGGGDELEEGEVSGGGADSDGEEEELKPLPDILTCISQKFRQVRSIYELLMFPIW